MAKSVSDGLDEVTGYFAQLEAPRSSVNRLHPLESVVVIAILAILAGRGLVPPGSPSGRG